MRTFDDWFADLISNHVWAGPAQLHHKPETFKSLCNKVYMDYLAGNGVKSMEDCRRHVYHLVCKTPTDNKVDWVAKGIEELKKKEVKEEWKPVSWEKRAEYLRQVQAEIDKISDKKVRPLLSGESETNGQYDKPKPAAKCVPPAPIEVIVEHVNKVERARRKYFLEKHPDATEEEIQAYLRKFDTI